MRIPITVDAQHTLALLFVFAHDLENLVTQVYQQSEAF